METPKEALIPGVRTEGGDGLPADARALLERGRVPFVEAYRFLGIERSAAYPLARRYIKRIARLEKSGKPFDLAELLPRRDADGRWREIPAYQVGSKYLCRSDLLVRMLYPGGGG